MTAPRLLAALQRCVAVFTVAACAGPTRSTVDSDHPPAATVATPSPRPLVAIEAVPTLDVETWDQVRVAYEAAHRLAPGPPAGRDCRQSVVARTRWAGTLVRPCGAFFASAVRGTGRRKNDLEAAAQAMRCVAEAITTKQPFLVEQQLPGIDSTIAAGLIGVVEADRLVVYSLWYDSDPCGGSCPAKGGTRIRRCDPVDLHDPSREPCVGLECVRCDTKPATTPAREPVATCTVGEAP